MGFWSIYLGLTGGGGTVEEPEPTPSTGTLYLRRTIIGTPVYFAKRYVTQT